MKSLMRFMVVLLVVLPLMACGIGGDDGILRIAVIMPSAKTDVAFSQSMFDAVKSIQAEMGGEEAVIIASEEGLFRPPDATEAMRKYADEGFDLVIAHGSQYGTPISEVAPDYPATTFAWGTGVDTFDLPNVSVYQAKAEEGGYVNGVMAALMTKSGIIGVTGPVEAGDAKLYVDGFINGVKSVNPDTEVNVTYTGSFSDNDLMAEAANNHIAAGADILTGASQSVVGAIHAAQEQDGVFWFGTQAEQSPLAPDVVVASQIYDWAGILRDIIEKRQAGTLGGEAYTITLENGGLKIGYNEGISVPDEVKSAAGSTIDGIKRGAINPMP